MTFVLNVLHDEYSLLAADRQANVDGPATIKVGSVTIHAQKGATINGYRKMKVSKCGAVAIGVAGTIKEHGYVDNFENVEGVEGSVKAVLDSIQNFFLSPDRSQNFSKPEVMRNEGIATFFDMAASRYFSLLYLYSHLAANTYWFNVASGSAHLLHVGSGSGQFEKAVGLDEINRFIASIKSNPDPRACIDWIKDAFGKVSLVAKGVGKEPEFLLSTRSERAFKSFG